MWLKRTRTSQDCSCSTKRSNTYLRHLLWGTVESNHLSQSTRFTVEPATNYGILPQNKIQSKYSFFLLIVQSLILITLSICIDNIILKNMYSVRVSNP